MSLLSPTLFPWFVIAISTVLVLSVETVTLAWLGKGGWMTGLRSAATGLSPLFAVIVGSWLFVQTSFFEKHLAWSMVVMLPFLGYYLLLWGAVIVKTGLQCWISGPLAGLICGFVVFPMLCYGISGPPPSLWTILSDIREPNNMEEAVERDNVKYIRKHMTRANRDEVFKLAIAELSVPAARLALDAGSDPNKLVAIRAPTARTPLVLALDNGETGLGHQKFMDQRRRKFVEELLHRGADPNLRSPKVVFYSTSPNVGKFQFPLEVAARDPELVQLLQMKGATIVPRPATSPTSSPTSSTP